MKKWEYKVVDLGIAQLKTFAKAISKGNFSDPLGARLTDLGKEGWELVCAVSLRSVAFKGDSFEQRYVFKRRLKLTKKKK